ncbi:MAG: carbon-nitrogen hydrolase family protein [Hyphomicrobiaceae bacterium]
MKIAAIQASPVFLDPRATTEKAISLLHEAARNGAKVAAFPEVFISGYPIWLRPLYTRLTHAQQQAAHAAYVAAGISAEGPELREVATSCAKLGIFAFVGFIERSLSGAVYCAIAAISPDRGIVGIHRKLKPTATERLVWADGDAHALKVHEWQGLRMGALNCFENWQPLARQTLYAQGEQLHVMCWPGRKDHAVDVARFVAMEGRVHVLSVGAVMHNRDIPSHFPLANEPGLEEGLQVATGGAMIVRAGGSVVAGPIADEETILYGEIDPAEAVRERDRLDPAGHYLRPDLFALRVRDTRLTPVQFEN